MSVLAAMRAAGLGPSCCVVGEEEAAPSGRGPTPALHSPVFSLPPRGGRWTVGGGRWRVRQPLRPFLLLVLNRLLICIYKSKTLGTGWVRLAHLQLFCPGQGERVGLETSDPPPTPPPCPLLRNNWDPTPSPHFIWMLCSVWRMESPDFRGRPPPVSFGATDFTFLNLRCIVRETEMVLSRHSVMTGL